MIELYKYTGYGDDPASRFDLLIGYCQEIKDTFEIDLDCVEDTVDIKDKLPYI